jgi:hypothetical protein
MVGGRKNIIVIDLCHNSGFELKAIITAPVAQRLQTGSSDFELSSAATTSRSSSTGCGLQAMFSKRFFFSSCRKSAPVRWEAADIFVSGAIVGASLFVRFRELISRAEIEIERSCLDQWWRLPATWAIAIWQIFSSSPDPMN